MKQIDFPLKFSWKLVVAVVVLNVILTPTVFWLFVAFERHPFGDFAAYGVGCIPFVQFLSIVFVWYQYQQSKSPAAHCPRCGGAISNAGAPCPRCQTDGI